MKIRVPDSISEITLDMVQRVLLIEADEEISAFGKKIQVVSILTGLGVQKTLTISVDDLDRIYNELLELLSRVSSEDTPRKVKYLGREYGFIEDVRDMETGAFVDIDQMSTEEMYAANLHKIMAILYRPIEKEIGGRYRLKSYVSESPREREERQSVFLKHMTYDVVRGAASFFLFTTANCLNISDQSFPQIHKMMATEVVGGGTILSTRSPENNSRKSKPFWRRRLAKQ